MVIILLIALSPVVGLTESLSFTPCATMVIILLIALSHVAGLTESLSFKS